MNSKIKQKIAQRILFSNLVFFTLFLACFSIDPDCEDCNNVDNTKYSVSEEFSYNVSVNSQNSIVVEAINGSIDIKAMPGITTVKIEGQRCVKSESEADAEEHLQELKVLVTDSGNEIRVKTEQPQESYGRVYEVNYYIEIPDNWEIDIKHVNGEITIENLNASVEIDLVNGKIDLGEIHGNVDVNLVNGNIDSKVYLPTNGKCEMHIVNGEIDLDLPKTTSAEFWARVTNGTVNVNELTLTDIQSSRNYISGTLNSGKGSIHLESTNGKISVNGF